jgi:hypothetical protein
MCAYMSVFPGSYQGCRCAACNALQRVLNFGPLDSRQSPPPLQTWRRLRLDPAPVSTEGRTGVGGSSDGQNEQSRIVLPPETGEYVFITAVPITKLFAWGEGDSGGHVLRETTQLTRPG